MAEDDVRALSGYRDALKRLPTGAALEVAQLDPATPPDELAALNPDGDRTITRDEALRFVDGLMRRAASPSAELPFDGMSAAFNVTSAMVRQSPGAQAVLKAPTVPSRRSLLEIVDRFWSDRQQPVTPDDVYRLYSEPRETNPLSRAPADYRAGLARIAAARGPDAISNVQGLNLRPPVPNDAISPLIAAAASGSLPANASAALDKTFFRFERAQWRPEAIRERVYIHAAADHVPELAAFLVGRVLDRPADFPGVEMVKVSGPGAAGRRSENVVIYTDGEASAERVVTALRAYRRDHPEHFMTTTNMMTNQRLPGVSRGAEPPDRYGGRYSFGSLRAAVVAQAFDEVRQRPNIKKHELVTHLDELLRAAGIDPERPHRNLEVPR